MEKIKMMISLLVVVGIGVFSLASAKSILIVDTEIPPTPEKVPVFKFIPAPIEVKLSEDDAIGVAKAIKTEYRNATIARVFFQEDETWFIKLALPQKEIFVEVDAFSGELADYNGLMSEYVNTSISADDGRKIATGFIGRYGGLPEDAVLTVDGEVTEWGAYGKRLRYSWIREVSGIKVMYPFNHITVFVNPGTKEVDGYKKTWTRLEVVKYENTTSAETAIASVEKKIREETDLLSRALKEPLKVKNIALTLNAKNVVNETYVPTWQLIVYETIEYNGIKEERAYANYYVDAITGDVIYKDPYR